VKKLRLAGAEIIGKTNTHEIALGVTGVNPHFGPVRNPHNLERITGGSSSGSAAAVAAGMAFAALGTDTGGSIRIPAALCGVVGLKPTHGRISTSGVLPLSWNLDHVGPLTRSVRDAALLLRVLAGYDASDPASADVPVEDYCIHLDEGIKGWRIAVAVGEYIETADPVVSKAVDEAARALRSNGAKVERTDFSWISDLAHANARMTQADAATFHRERLAEHPDWFGADVRHRLEKGMALTSSDYVLARRTQAEGRRRFEMFFTTYDILLLPTTPIPAHRRDGGSPSRTPVDAFYCAIQFNRPSGTVGPVRPYTDWAANRTADCLATVGRGAGFTGWVRLRAHCEFTFTPSMRIKQNQFDSLNFCSE
jgi:aspartyl-tRNA(Asn)/glutamyl-tRNA(Gln) amidotransferase subunit A